MFDLIKPNWPAPDQIKAYSTTRVGGFSKTPFASFNLAIDKGDDPESVRRNRELLHDIVQLPSEPRWLTQVHGTDAVQLECQQITTTADAAYTYKTNRVCTVLTADCLPVLLCDRNASCVAAIHAGWKGLAAGVIEATVAKLSFPGKELLAWLGPAIGPQMFEVGDEVRQQFIAIDPQAMVAFKANINNRWLANIYLLAKQRLNRCGISEIYGGEFCTYTDEKCFFSYRRDKQTGRMATLIWLSD